MSTSRPIVLQQSTNSAENLQTQIYREQANTYAAAGKVVPYKGIRSWPTRHAPIAKSNLYNGGKEEEPATITSPEDIARLPFWQRAFIIPSGAHKGGGWLRSVKVIQWLMPTRMPNI